MNLLRILIFRLFLMSKTGICSRIPMYSHRNLRTRSSKAQADTRQPAEVPKADETSEQVDELSNFDVVVRAERGSMGMRMVALEALRDNAAVERLSGKLPLSPLRLVFPESFPNSGTSDTRSVATLSISD